MKAKKANEPSSQTIKHLDKYIANKLNDHFLLPFFFLFICWNGSTELNVYSQTAVVTIRLNIKSGQIIAVKSFTFDPVLREQWAAVVLRSGVSWSPKPPGSKPE